MFHNIGKLFSSTFQFASAPTVSPSFFSSKLDDTANVIIGLGPAGIAHAIEAAQNDSKKRKVIALTDRINYSRSAIFRLDVDIFPYLEQLIGKEKMKEAFDKGLFGPKQSLNGWDFHVIQIMTLEKLLFEKLQQLPNVEIIQIPKHSASQIKAIDTKTHRIELAIDKVESKEAEHRSIKFKYLIATDGAKHEVRNRIKDCDVEYFPTQDPQLWEKQVRVTYKLPKEYCSNAFRQFILPFAEVKKENIQQLKDLGWTLNSIPEVRVFTVDGYLFVAAECPKQFKPEDEAILDRWIRTILARTCPETAVSALEKVDSAVFDVVLEEANRTIVPYPGCDTDADTALVHEKCAYFVQAGDSLRKTHYQTGSGAVVSLRESKAFGEFMRSGQTLDDLIEFHAKIAAIRAENRVRVDKFIEGRVAREKQASLLPSLTISSALMPAEKKGTPAQRAESMADPSSHKLSMTKMKI